MCSSGYPTYSKILPHTPNFCSKFWSWKRIAEQNNFVLLFSSNFRIWRKNTSQNDLLKWKSKFLCIQSLEEVKGLKQGYIFKNGPFYISFFLFNTFPSRSEYIKKKSFRKKKKFLPTYPNNFQDVTWTTYIFLFGLMRFVSQSVKQGNCYLQRTVWTYWQNH